MQGQDCQIGLIGLGVMGKNFCLERVGSRLWSGGL